MADKQIRKDKNGSKSNNAKLKLDKLVDKIRTFYDDGDLKNDGYVDELFEEFLKIIESTLFDGKTRAFKITKEKNRIDTEETDYFGKNASEHDYENDGIYRYVNKKKLDYLVDQINKVTNEIKLDKSKESDFQNNVHVNESHMPLDLPLLKEDFPDGLRVFISHKFVEKDQQLALELQKLLLDNHINGYMAERIREYELLIGDKIKKEIIRSDYLVAILTKTSIMSPSVNEEIGYALGKNIPVLILVEKDINSGVLSHGREPEIFTHSNFEIPFKNIVDHIVKNGGRKKITDEEKKDLVQNVYEPCYNMLKNLEHEEFFTTLPPNPWKESLTHSWRLRTEPEMTDIFEEHNIELEKWKKMMIDFGNKFQTNQEKLGDILKPAFEKCGLVENGYVRLKISVTTPKDWLHYFDHVIFNSEIQTVEELYQILKNETTRRHGEENSEYLDIWKKEKPEIYAEILKLIPELVKVLGAKYSYSQIDAQRQILKESIKKLTLALEEKLKK